MAGMPPLSGFIGKLLILDSARDPSNMVWVWSIVLGTSLLAVIGFARGGSTLFWKSYASEETMGHKSEFQKSLAFVSIGFLLAMTVFLTAFAGPVTDYLDKTSAQLFTPKPYVDAVLGPQVEEGH